ncbi:TonB-dependent receptor [Muricauda ruestringensis]|jgi:TonB-dependent receptor|uniref:Collagen-binding protein n=1 Tax=Flagellimonas marinaquae TaxID=254955 RepID=A0AA48HEQ1_9FLAO|nr:TonB-dependent receptor [Allomuricauda ruestringensis]MCA0958970.1 TonB-dependent receptor [Allomuricauda ruestringensis]BDW92063.1 collagen-binding protein [Allomuricauda aquimarina]
MKTYLILALSLFTFSLSAQQNGSVVGKLTDKELNDDPLPFANVLIKGTTMGTTSDFDGLFQIADVEPGTYTLVFSFLGYETLEIPNVLVEAGKVTEINAGLGASSVGLDEVVVTTTARKDSEIALLLQQKNALVMQEAISAEALTLKGIDDAAAAVAQISGISKQQGSSNVYVRGLGDRYQNTTMNGLALPSNDVEKKNINLDLFGSSIIENVSVSKAYSPTFYGDFAAGNVNIDSKEYTGDGYLEVSLGGGINSNAAGEEFFKSEGTSDFGFYNRYDNDPFAVVLSHGVDPESAWEPINLSGAIEGGYSFDFNNDKSRLSFFGTASFSNGFEIWEGPARDFTNVLKVDFPNVREYAYKTTTTALANVTYRINTENKLKFSSLFVNSAADRVGYYGVNGQGTNRDAILDTDQGFYVMNVQFNQDMIFVNQLTGQHLFDDKLSLDWGVGFNKVFSDEPDRKRITLENYQFALDNDDSTNPVFYTNIPFDNQRFFQSIDENELNSFMNLGYKVSDKVKLNFGYNGRRKERRFNSTRYGYDIVNRDNTPITDVNNLNSIFNVENINIPAGEGLWNTIVLNPITNEIGNTNRPGLPENTYKGNLGIHAFYTTAELGVTDKFSIVPGIRIESFSQKVKYDVINISPVDPGFREVYENIFLPSINVKYALTENSNLRAGFSKTASFPEFKEVAPFVYESVTQRVGGNPDLLGGLDGNGPTYSDIYNYDVKYEWFLERGEIISIAAFAKTIKDPVNRVVAADATGTQRYFRTGEQADIYGVELEARKNLLMDSDDNAIVSMGLNAAYTHTEQDLKDIPAGTENTFGTSFDRDSDELEGASPFIINADLNYSPTFGNYRPKATVAFSYFSDRIFSLGAGSLGNIVEKAVPTLNFVWQNSFGEHFEANLSAKNILDPDISLIREGTDLGDIVIREYNLGVNIGLTLKYKF